VLERDSCQVLSVFWLMETCAKHIIFTGFVQGVGFRFTSHRISNRYGLSGWVRNLPNGTVEMFVQGPEESIQSCSKDIQEAFRGYIQEAKTENVPPDPKLKGFQVTF